MPKVRKIFSMIVGGERDSINLKDSIMYNDLIFNELRALCNECGIVAQFIANF